MTHSPLQPYGDLTLLNGSRLVLDAVGPESLALVAGDYLAILDTSAAIYEKNGDYALGIFASGWCRFLDQASRRLCDTDDNRQALGCGRWHCHESCWTEVSQPAVASGQPVDLPCRGGLRILAVPVKAGEEVVGVINLGYGDPPLAPEPIQAIAALYQVDPAELRRVGERYVPRPPQVVEAVKLHLHAAARLLGARVEAWLAAKALGHGEERFRLLYERAPMPYQSLDEQGNFLEVNPAWLAALGYARDEVIGRNFSEFLHPDWRGHFLENFPRFKAVGEVLGVEFEMVRKDGSLIMVSFQGKIGKDEWGRFRQTHCIFQDISERHRMEEEKANLEAQLRQAHKMEAIGRLAGGIAHDFNNILGAILGYAEIGLDLAMQGRPSPEELAQIIRSVDRARGIIRQILTFSRKIEADHRPLDLHQELRQTVEMLRHTLPKEIAVALEMEPGQAVINGDPAQVAQVILNLVANAHDAMPWGGRLTLATCTEIIGPEALRMGGGLAPGRYLRLTISDTGEGMSEEVRGQIFDPFFTTKEVGKGTGLGLATVYGIVKAHGGHIECHSRPGEGAVFVMHWPLLESEPVRLPPAPDVASTVCPPARVLVVDDEEGLRRVLRKTLVAQGHQVLEAASGEQALDIYRDEAQAIDLVLLDLGMPGMGGRRCLEEMLRLNPAAKVVVTTGYLGENLDGEVMALGAVGMIPKPYQRAQVLAALARHLGGPGEAGGLN